jgi:hypothetical protein
MQTEQEIIEQPGKNAEDHPCEIKVEIPGDDGEESTYKSCRILALLQCAECAAWVCGTEELGHALICVRCDGVFCPEHFQAHRQANRCLEEAA